MSYLYVCEQGSVIHSVGNRIEIKYKDGLLRSIPVETLEVIEVFGNIQLTSGCISTCLKRGINVIFFSRFGSYYGRLISTNHVNVNRQRIQADIDHDSQFKLELSKRIIEAKIHNQIVILRRYSKNTNIDLSHKIAQMKNLANKVSYDSITTSEQIMGYEGTAARYYFNALGKVIDSDFTFDRRTRRPPEDPFNSTISLGYSILMNEIYGKIEGKGMNPYFGFLHKDREKHPSLASDLMEEWRAVLIDSISLGMINGHELHVEDYYKTDDKEGVFLKPEGFKKYVKKLEDRLLVKTKYLQYIDYPVSFRQALDLQINQLLKAYTEKDASLYHPVRIR